MGRIVSVNVGRPRVHHWRGERVRTAIFKSPAPGRTFIGRLNLEGDAQADRRHHGGPSMSVYSYPSEHYAWWRERLPEVALTWGIFGENLTVEGLPAEDALSPGDRLRAGSAELMVTQPRIPCYKLGLRFGREEIEREFLESGRCGFYSAVLVEGEVAPGDRAELVERADPRVDIRTLARLYVASRIDPDDRLLLARAAELEALPDSWRQRFRRALNSV